MKVLNFGSMNLDYVYQVDHFVLPGETISAGEQKVVCGGKGLNQSVALSHAGACVYHAGCIGTGGQVLKDMLQAENVHTDYIVNQDVIQGNAVIQVNPSGENCILLFGGSNQCITDTQIEETLSHFEAGDYLLLQNEINEISRIVEKAYEKDMVIVLNPSPFDEKISSIDLSKISWLLINEVEAAQLLQMHLKKEGSKTDAAVSDLIAGITETPSLVWDALHENYPELSVVITLGAKGSVLFSGDEVIHQPAFPVEAVDTTAAGDTFTGFFVDSLMAGRKLSECMERASIASSISVTRFGAAPSVPSNHEVFMREKQELTR